MPFLEILHPSGETERRELKKQSPITIGQHSSNDIVVDEPGVAVMHCRISWIKGGFEAVAATAVPLDINSIPKQRSILKAGDLLRFGSIDIRYRDSDQDGADSGGLSIREAAFSLKSIEKLDLPEAPPPSPPPQSPAPGEPPASPGKPASPKPKQVPKPKQEPVASDAVESVDDFEETSPNEYENEEKSDLTTAAESAENPLTDRVRRAVRSQRDRPGEEDPLRSPLVLGLGGGAAALLLTGAIFYFIAWRQTTQQAFDQARMAYDQGNYRASIAALQTFIDSHTRQPLTIEAQRLLGMSKVRQLIEGAAPRYPEGLVELRKFIDEQKDLDGFETLHADLMTLAKTLSLGAAQAAGKLKDPQLLEVSQQARTILKAYSPQSAPPTETLNQIEQVLRSSRSRILQDEVYREHLADIDASLIENDPLKAMRIRRNLLIRYPGFAQDQKVSERMQTMLDAERKQTVFAELDQAAETKDHDWPKNVLTLCFHSRIRTDEVSTGQAVMVLAQDCCYGVEMATGEPLWRRVIGLNPPFFPLLDATGTSVVLFDTNFQEVVRLQRKTGELIWRQPLGKSVSGLPLWAGDLLYLPTEDHKLLTLDVESGRLTGVLQFSQPVSGPVLLDDRQQMVVAGDREVLYLLNQRPLECISVFDLGQPARSIQAPLLSVASYLLAIENGQDRATLHLLNTGEPSAKESEQKLSLADTATVTGRVIDPPVIRGRDLFVPSIGGRVSAFSLSDDPGQPPITPGPVFFSEGKSAGTISLLAGPDRQLWMSAGGLTRLRLTTETLQPDGDSISTGAASQPIQFLAGSLFSARRRASTVSVTTTRTDRDDMTSDWQTGLGSPILAWSQSGEKGSAVCALTDAGLTYRVQPRQITGHEFLSEVSVRLPLSVKLNDPLLAGEVSKHRIAVAAGGTEPQAWIISPAGQIESTSPLPHAPQASPCGLGTATLIPIEGSMFVLPAKGKPAVQAFALPTDEQQTWRSVSPLSDDQAAAVTTTGTVILLKLNETPQPYLGEVARVELGAAVSFPAQHNSEWFVVADQSGKVSLFENERLERQGTRIFEEPISGPVRIVGNQLFVETSQQKLHCLKADEPLTSQWSMPLQKTSLTGVILHQGQLIFALQDGTVLFVDPQSGLVLKQFELQTALTIGPVVSGESLIVGSADGSIIPVGNRRSDDEDQK